MCLPLYPRYLYGDVAGLKRRASSPNVPRRAGLPEYSSRFFSWKRDSVAV